MNKNMTALVKKAMKKSGAVQRAKRQYDAAKAEFARGFNDGHLYICKDTVPSEAYASGYNYGLQLRADEFAASQAVK